MHTIVLGASALGDLLQVGAIRYGGESFMARAIILYMFRRVPPTSLLMFAVGCIAHSALRVLRCETSGTRETYVVGVLMTWI